MKRLTLEAASSGEFGEAPELPQLRRLLLAAEGGQRAREVVDGGDAWSASSVSAMNQHGRYWQMSFEVIDGIIEKDLERLEAAILPLMP